MLSKRKCQTPGKKWKFKLICNKKNDIILFTISTFQKGSLASSAQSAKRWGIKQFQ